MASAPVLQGFTLAHVRNPGGYSQRRGQRAASLEVANSNLIFQRLISAAKAEFALTWVALTTSQYTTIASAYDALLSTGGSNNFTDPLGSTYTVTPMPDNPPLDAEYTETPRGGAWNVAMRLRQV